MTTVRVNIHSADGITTEIVGRGKGRITAERNPRIGTPGGMGYGGGEILTFAAGVCFYNNLRRLANDRGIVLKTIEVEVIAETSDDPPATREITIKPKIESDAGKSEIQDVMTQALEESYVADMLTHSVSVKLDSMSEVA
jgi:uncharacterized OsmC-like protein